ncbi:hypothetical protein E2C01_006651 [Portunus trituberculatus]|uniref:Uncharacterized protein n=1 Tax=Portunus trituberculatus TaxID=210409 RepID=A0A5B7D2E1_PORTR|nr:hypothetical protein [Portunus trituberculatus]
MHYGTQGVKRNPPGRHSVWGKDSVMLDIFVLCQLKKNSTETK